jgi:predicted  nucleic acid-binding Zn-ribbon protein
MSKELTDKWRNGNIQETYYYVKCPWSEGEVDIRYVHNGVDDWKEIVDNVPSYTDLCELKQELEICKDEKADLYAKLCSALMQLEECKKKTHILNEANMKLENMVGKLCEQLKEANKIIKKLYKESGNPIGCDYLKKWGVK